MRVKTSISFTIIYILFSSSIFAQTCIPSLTKSTPTEDFIVHNNGTVTHKKTGLMWLVCSYGQTWQNGSCVGTATKQKWDNGKQLLTLDNLAGNGFPAGYSDWREPNVKELLSIVETSCHSPSINETIFPSTPSSDSLYWSTSPMALNDQKAWSVYFTNGYDWVLNRYHPTDPNIIYSSYIRFVRDTN
jgi:hypothetical protein